MSAPPKTLVIRAATDDDAAAVCELAGRFATSFSVDPVAFHQTFSDLLAIPHGRLLVAVEDGDVIGYCLAFDHATFFANGRVTWVEEVMVAERVRGRGVGARLMDAVEQWAVNRGSRMIALATRRAEDFYSSLGYQHSASYFRKMLADA